MGTNLPLRLAEEEKLHIDIMRAVAQDFHDIPMVLKGGTALLLCYGLDRFSEDLDFDSPKKFNIAGRVDRILSQFTKTHLLKTVKDTQTVQRIKAHYVGVTGDRLLKIETSLRATPDETKIITVNGIRTYTVASLIDQKVYAISQRTAARDLYDISFLTRTYPADFSKSAIAQLKTAMQDISAVEQNFQGTFEEDEILDVAMLPEIIFQITDFLQAHP